MDTEVKSKIISLLENNDVSVNLFFEETYKCLIVSIFEVLVHEMSDEIFKIKLRNRLRNSTNKIVMVKNVVWEITKCKINDEEANELYNYLYAYFRKSNNRKIYSDELKKDLLIDQSYCCNICKKQIKLQTSELDHIIPWTLVGDELGITNLQMLCIDCNRRKSKNIAYNLKMFLVNK